MGLTIRATFVLALLAHVDPAVAQQTAPRDVASNRSLAIRGRVISDDMSAPLRRVRIALRGDDEAEPTFTDDEGRFQIVLSGPAEGGLRITKAGFAPLFVSRPSLESADADFMLRMVKAASISGLVMDRLGAPAVGVHVRMQRTSGSGTQATTGPAQFTTETDDLGEFRVGNLPAGRYEVWAGDWAAGQKWRGRRATGEWRPRWTRTRWPRRRRTRCPCCSAGRLERGSARRPGRDDSRCVRAAADNRALRYGAGSFANTDRRHGRADGDGRCSRPCAHCRQHRGQRRHGAIDRNRRRRYEPVRCYGRERRLRDDRSICRALSLARQQDRLRAGRIRADSRDAAGSNDHGRRRSAGAGHRREDAQSECRHRHLGRRVGRAGGKRQDAGLAVAVCRWANNAEPGDGCAGSSHG